MNDTIGIDFGTSNLVISYWDPQTDLPDTIPYGEKNTIPAVILFQPDQSPLIGDAARERILEAEDLQAEEREKVYGGAFFSIKMALQENPMYAFGGSTKDAVAIASELLAEVRKYAEKNQFHDRPVTSLCVTHPACFSITAIANLRKAAEMAGFRKVETRSEPLAAIMGYSLVENEPLGNNILVFDLGGGTFDLAFAHRDRGGQVHFPFQSGLAKAGDWFDRALFSILRQKAKEKNVSLERMDRNMQIRVQKLKHRLSSNQGQIARFRITEGVSVEVTLEEFHKVIEPAVLEIFEKTRAMIQQVKRLQEEHPDENYKISSFLVVGGSSNIPLVQQKIEELHSKEHLIPKPLKLGKATWRAVALGAVVDQSEWEKPKPKEPPKPEPASEPAPEPEKKPVKKPLRVIKSDGKGAFDDLE